mgnify:CR=1 FL=1
MLYVFFFFRAEDGIRDAQESRGLGDVYKRKVVVVVVAVVVVVVVVVVVAVVVAVVDNGFVAFSFTLLTVPTTSYV